MTAEERRAKARTMRRRKPRPTVREIADELGVSIGTAHRYINPKAAKRYQVASRERRRRQRRQENIGER